jgi:uncharacterized protein
MDQPMTSTHLQPVAENERVMLLDVLRGFALLGILLVNFTGTQGTLMPGLDALVSKALAALISESFYPLFSFLFGLGFAMQLARAGSRGSGASLLYLRRMLVLFLIGTVHATLIWAGDILVRYAITGLLLIPLHRLPQKAVLALSVVLFATLLNGPAVRSQVESWRGAQRGEAAELILAARAQEERIAENRHRLIAETGASYAVTSANRWTAYARQIRSYGDWLSWVLNDVLFCFLVGLMVGRARVLQEVARRRRTLLIAASTAFVTACAGLLANAAMDLPTGFLATAAWFAENYGMTAFYICGIALLYTFSGHAHRVLSVFAAPGRMGLTNYLTQSVIMTWLSMSYGLGWEPSTAIWLMLNLGFFFGVQVPLSRWWLKRFRFGPAEWLWRSVTYGRKQPMKLARPASTMETAPAVTA